ncbi:MAG: hypothetical protein V1492_01510 [Candidatus Micrarchaeota archaeon]
MKQRAVHYIANQSNQRIVAVLKTIKPLCDVTFIQLAPERAEALIPKIPHGNGFPAVFMWGDGYSHHHSFFFDKTGSSVIKRNIDAHPDWIPRDVDSITSADRPPLNYGNHMATSEELHKVTAQFALPEVVKICASSELTGYIRRAMNNRMIMPQRSETLETQFYSKVVEPDTAYDRKSKIHLTIDFDSVQFFPSAAPHWVMDAGFTAPQIAAAVSKAREIGRLERLDLGGCADSLPEFTFMPPKNLENPHLDIGLVREISYMAMKDRHRNPEKLMQKTKDAICSYAVACYQQVLQAALFD